MKNKLLSFLTMKADCYYLNENSTIRQALEAFDYHKYTVVPLINDEGEYVTTLSEGDILRYIKNNCDFDIKKAEKVKVCDLEKYRSYQALPINTSFETLEYLAVEQNFIPIKDDRGMFIGIIKRKDVLRQLIKQS